MTQSKTHDTAWDQLIARLENDLPDTPLPRIARERRAAGMDPQAFTALIAEALDMWERRNNLGAVFRRARAEGWCMKSEAIDAAYDAAMDGASAEEAYAAAHAAEPKPPTADPLKTWMERQLAFQDAVKAHEAAVAAVEEADDQLGLRCPFPAVLRYHMFDRSEGRRRPSIYTDEASIEKAFPVMVAGNLEKREQLIAALRKWREDREATAKALNIEALQAANDARREVFRQARAALLSTPPPNLEALLYQLDVAAPMILRGHHVTTELIDAGTALETPDEPGAVFLQMYGHLRRLTGQGAAFDGFLAAARAEFAADVATAEACDAVDGAVMETGVDYDGFNAADFRRALEAEGVTFRIYSQTDVGAGWPDPHQPRLRALLDEIQADPSKLRAVKWLVWRDAQHAKVGLPTQTQEPAYVAAE